MPGLELEVVVADPRPVLHLFDLDIVLLLARRPSRLGLLEAILPVIHDLHYGRPRRRRHLDQVEAQGAGFLERFIDRHYADLLSVCPDQPHRADPDLFVHPNPLFVVLNSQLGLLLKKETKKRTRSLRSP